MNVTMNDDFDPVADLNTTPLIDVMLVLLVMFIVTIPIQTHAVKVDLPSDAPVAQILNVNLITISREGGLAWNGAPISVQGLRQVIVASQQRSPIPELHLRPDADARFEDVDKILALIKREHVTRFGFVGNEIYRSV